MRQWIQKPPLGVQINWTNPISRGLIAYWLMNEGVGNKIYDLSGNNNIGTLVGDTKWVAGKFGSCLSFDGDGDYVDAGDINAIDIATQLTGIAWINCAAFTVDNTIFHKGAELGGAGNPQVLLFRDDAGGVSGRTDIIQIYIYDGANTARIEGATGSGGDTNWHQVAFTYIKGSSTGLRLYIDGKEDPWSPVSTVALGSHANAYNFRIGSPTTTTGKDFNGLIDNVIIYNRALTGTEVQQLYREPFYMFNKKFIGKI